MNKKEIISCLKEMREACAACFRVIGRHELTGVLETEFHKTIVQNGFGVKCQKLIEKLEKE